MLIAATRLLYENAIFLGPTRLIPIFGRDIHIAAIDVPSSSLAKRG